MRQNAPLSRILLCQALTTTALLAGSAVATEDSAKQGAAETRSSSTAAVAPEGKTLPANVARFRLVHRSYNGQGGFDANGLAVDLGYRSHTRVTAVVGELALSERLSFRIMAPYVYRNEASLDQEAMRRSQAFQVKYAERARRAAGELRKTQLCHTEEQCLSFIERGESLPFARDMVLESGEALSLRAGTPIKQAIEATMLGSVTPADEGARGLGDVEAGLLYNFYRSERIMLSTGLGVRLPTGDFSVPDARRPTSGGVADAGLRFNFDFAPMQGLWISLQEQIEYALTDASWRRPSMLDSSQFNLADPSDGGDDAGNFRRLQKRGLTSDSLVRANYGLGALANSLEAVAVNLSYQYKRDRPIYLDESKYKDASSLHYAGVGANISGLPYRIPVELEVNYAQPFAGQDARLAASVTETMLKVYTRF